MEMTQVTREPVPVWIAEAVARLAPSISASTQFVCKTIRPEFGSSARDELLGVRIMESESVKTTRFETDGSYEDLGNHNYADGWVTQRQVKDWTYVLIENAVRGTTANAKIVQTVYVKDKRFCLELRRAVGLPGY